MKNIFFLFNLLFNSLLGFSQNLINNGSFEYGGVGLGFWLDGIGYVELTEPFSGNSSAGNFAFVDNPQSINNSSFNSSGDHTTGEGLMMVIDGNTTGGQQRFWKAGDNGGGICNLNVGETYYFSYWIQTVTTAVSGESQLADIGVFINNASNVTLTFGTTLAPLPNFGWQKVSYSFTATNSCVNIELYNNNTNAIGNDFAIDDIKLTPPPDSLSFTHSVTQPNCVEENSGMIVIYPTGGQPPYLFRINGPQPIPITNYTGVFTDLAPGNYTIGLMDNNGEIDSLQNIIVSSISTLNVNVTDTSICPGEPIQLSVNGGNGIYLWESDNPLETGFPSSEDTITVSPNIQTVYTVSSEVNNSNLIFNGDFEQGNVGFYSQYTHFPNNSQGAQRAYSVLNNPSNLFPDFSMCIDHTQGNGFGKMMVVDGSTYNIGNDAFWCQRVAVEPNKNYSFSYWATSLTQENTAQIRIIINGEDLGIVSVPSQNCSWGLVDFIWNSGDSLVAEICLFDANYEANGNDFAIDDIQMLSLNTCQQSVNVQLSTADPFYDIYFPSAVCTNEDNILPLLGPSHVSGGVYNSSPAGLNINPLTGEIQCSNSNEGLYNITYIAEVCGQFIPDTFIIAVKNPPQLIELSGGLYNCSEQKFDSLIAYLDGNPQYTIFYSLDGEYNEITSFSDTALISSYPGLYIIDSLQDNVCSIALSAQFYIDSTQEPQKPIIQGDTIYCLNTIASPLEISNQVGQINWYSDEQLLTLIGSGLPFIPSTQQSSTLYVTQTVNDCEGPSTFINITVEPCGFIIPSAFTPNDDADNDYWDIVGVDSNFPNNQVFVYNRWGEKLYESIQGNYSNDPWDGKYKEEILPSGSYFYIIEFNDFGSTESINGVVTILKEKN